jgi:hypothetical protein
MRDADYYNMRGPPLQREFPQFFKSREVSVFLAAAAEITRLSDRPLSRSFRL